MPAFLSEPAKGSLFIELFAGTARLSKALSSCGVSSLPIDVRFGVSHDVTQPSVRKWICDLLRSGCCIGLWIAIPCTTLSRARDRNRLTRVRGNEGRDLFGLPDLNPEQRGQVTSANRIINFCVALCRLANSLSISWYIENPRTSKLWLLPCIVDLQTPRTTYFLGVDFCQYGTPWKKATRILVSRHDDLAELSRRCAFSNPGYLCSNTGKRHICLSGFDATGLAFTKRAEPYPLPLCRAIAAAVKDHCVDMWMSSRALL